MSKVKHGRGYVYSLQYHIIWCTKYRKKILIGDVEKDLKLLILHLCEKNKIDVLAMETDKDYIHLLIDCKPQHKITDIMRGLKGVSARLLLKQHPELKQELWGGHLWNPSYFVATVSENTEDQICKYISEQQNK